MAEKVEPFSGNQETNENPHNFFRTFQRIHLDTEASVAIARFKFYVEAGEDADVWFASLSPDRLTDWVVFEAAFVAQWPPVEKAAKEPGEYEDDLLKLRLREADLGKKVEVGGREVWAHVKWANDALKLATKAKISTTATLIRQVRRELPDVIKDNVGAKPTDWTVFTKAVRSVDVDTIQDYIDRMARATAREEDRSRALLQSVQDLARISRPRAPIPIASVKQPIIQSPQFPPGVPAQPRVLSGRPFEDSGRTRTNVFAMANTGQRSYERPPITDDERRNLSRLLELLPHHPPTAAGNEAYHRQIADWNMLQGVGARPSATNPYPLRPGTAGLCSGECFRCGTHGHRSFNCPHPTDAQVPRNETIWRSLCSRELGPIRAPNAAVLQPTAVNLVYITDHMGRVHLGGGEYDDETQNLDGEQGNGEGSSA